MLLSSSPDRVSKSKALERFINSILTLSRFQECGEGGRVDYFLTD